MHLPALAIALSPPASSLQSHQACSHLEFAVCFVWNALLQIAPLLIPLLLPGHGSNERGFPTHLIVLAMTSNTMSNENNETDYPCLSPDLREKKLDFSLLNMTSALACDFWPTVCGSIMLQPGMLVQRRK